MDDHGKPADLSNLDPDTTAGLEVMTAAHGRSAKAGLQAIVEGAVSAFRERATIGWATDLAARYRQAGGETIEAPQQHPSIRRYIPDAA